jgi:PAS domain S-box-containing protein
MWIPNVRYIIAAGFLSTLFTVLGYYLSESNSELWIVVINRFVAVLLIWATVVFAIWHKRQNTEMLKKESMYRILFESVVEAILIINTEGLIIELNDTTVELFGYQREEMMGQKVELLMPQRHIHEHKNFRKDYAKAGQSRKMAEHQELFAKRKNGEEFPVEISLSNFRSEEELFVMAVVSDITERKEAQAKLEMLNTKLEQRVEERSQALKESQVMYKMVARNFPNGVISVLDKDLNYIFVEGMEMYRLGITSENLIGSSFLMRISHDVRDIIKDQLLSVLEGRDVGFELETDGRTYLISAVGLVGKEKEINQILMVSQNITGMKTAEANSLRALEKERSLNEMKTRFVSMASHEFRTPLTTAMNSLNLLSKYIQANRDIEKQERHIERINSAIHHLTNILNDFLSIDKLEQGKINITTSRINLLEFVEEAIDDMAGLQKKNQKILHEHTGEHEVEADKMMLKNIFNNLLSNAVKYSPEESTINVETRINDEQFIIVVKDHGMGVPAEDQNHLFERFFRAQNVSDVQGTGLGLNIIKKYVEIVGGTITFSSVEGKGSTFTVSLPRIEPANEQNLK